MENLVQSKDEVNAGIISDIMFYTRMVDELWSYHPDNEKRVDVVAEFENVQRILSSLESELQFDSEKN
jgi:hypothetical protein